MPPNTKTQSSSLSLLSNSMMHEQDQHPCEKHEKLYDSVIIGGGIAGVSTALELAQAGKKVLLLEQLPQLLDGSSAATARRLGIFHYPDLATNLLCLDSVLKFLERYGKYRLDYKDPNIQQYYFIMQGSQRPLEEITTLFGQLKEAYAQHCNDTNTQRLGEPDDFVKPLTPEALSNLADQGYIDQNNVVAGFRVAEPSLDWDAFRQYLVDEVNKNPNITVRTGVSVETISQWVASSTQSLSEFVSKESPLPPPPYIVTCKESVNPTYDVYGRTVVNATCADINRLNASLGLPTEEVQHRVKMIVKIRLPSEWYTVPNIFCCFGPFASLTNLSDGTALVTYEPKTNVFETHNGISDPDLHNWLDPNLNPEVRLQIAQEILEGVRSFIPGFPAICEIMEIRCGDVLTCGSDGLNKRTCPGVKEHRLGFIENHCVKLPRAPEDAKEVSKIIEKTLLLSENIWHILQAMKPNDIEWQICTFNQIRKNYSSEKLQQIDERGDFALAKEMKNKFVPTLQTVFEDKLSLALSQYALFGSAGNLPSPSTSNITNSSGSDSDIINSSDDDSDTGKIKNKHSENDHLDITSSSGSDSDIINSSYDDLDTENHKEGEIGFEPVRHSANITYNTYPFFCNSRRPSSTGALPLSPKPSPSHDRASTSMFLDLGDETRGTKTSQSHKALGMDISFGKI